MSMIDRVANAIIDMNFPDAVAVDLPIVEHYTRQARTIIEAMREPMPDADFRFEKISPAYKAVWREMIDAALATNSAAA